MQISQWVLVVIAVIILAIIVGYGYECSGRKIAEKDRDWQKARNDSILAAKVYSDTSYAIEIQKLKVLAGKKPASITIHQIDTVWKTTDTVASITIDTTLKTVDKDTSHVCEVPFKASIGYLPSFRMFLYDFELGTIKETKTIRQSSVVTNPPVIIEPSFWSYSEYMLIGGGVVAIILLILGAVH
jgi:hypothetical protein